MDKSELLRSVAPCGLVCYTCGGCDFGPLKEHSMALLHYLDGITYFLKGENKNVVENAYPMLTFFSEFNCPGCRGEKNLCKWENCVYRECTQQKGIDFCADCEDFPCDKEEIIHSWKSANMRIQEVGIEQFFDEEKNTPHYRWMKDK